MFARCYHIRYIRYNILYKINYETDKEKIFLIAWNDLRNKILALFLNSFDTNIDR